VVQSVLHYLLGLLLADALQLHHVLHVPCFVNVSHSLGFQTSIQNLQRSDLKRISLFLSVFFFILFLICICKQKAGKQEEEGKE
jgi:hypothetical protein